MNRRCSTNNTAHLAENCGKCHPDASDKFAQSKVHVYAASAKVSSEIRQQIKWWIRRLSLGLIDVVIGGMQI